MVKKIKITKEEMDNSEKEIVTKEIIKENAVEFSTRVENLVWEEDISYFDSVQKCAEQKAYEPERVSKLLTADLFAKLQREAEDRHLIKKENNTLDDI
jgi:hypothetical protein